MAFCRKCGSRLDPDNTCAVCLLAGGFDSEPGIARPDEAAPEQALENVPESVLEYDSFGPYHIIRLLGEGGMGAVYLAEQVRPLQRQVALKVVKLGMDSAQILSRFTYERQALAQMDHANIARVFDAGASEKGRPYFVMEYVDGIPITTYCDQHRLNTRERLELFLPVCLALQHAHQKGVIHRDIKPSNVMVAEVDSRPAPKVIDFGIAKATGQIGGGGTVFTQFGQFVGTPEYMSPEQADLVGADADTSSDVYSLGVLLYELLIGAVPFEARKLREAGLTEFLRIIRDEEAIPMTARLSQLGETATDIAGRRRTDPATLRRQVTGDLNSIAAKALEKDRRRRYPTASELAADIRRYLDDQPVMASPPNPAYRTWKFAKRHRFPLMAAAALAMVLVGGIIATTWAATIARRERAEAVVARALAERRSLEAERERKRTEEQTALAVRQRGLAEDRLNDVHTLADAMLFEISEDVRNLPGGTTAREALVRLGQRYLDKEAGAGAVDPERRRAMAEAFMKVGDLQGDPGGANLRDVSGALQSYSRGASMLEDEVAAHPRDAHLRHLLSMARVRQGQLSESAAAGKAELAKAARSAETYRKLWPEDVQGLRDQAEVLGAQGERAAAVALRERILAGNPHDAALRRELAQAQLSLGASLVQIDNQKALEWLQKAEGGCAALHKEERFNIQYERDHAVSLMHLARVLVPLNRNDDAVARALESKAILQQLADSDRRNAGFRLDLSDSAIALSNAYYRKGELTAALENIALAASIQQEQSVKNADNSDFASQTARYYRLAGEYKTGGRDFRGAREEYEKAEAIDRRLEARYRDRPAFADALRLDMVAKGDAWLALGDRPAAMASYRQALGVAEGRSADAEFPVGVITAHRGLAQVLKALARWDEAIAEQNQVVAICERQAAARPGDFDRQSALGYAAKELSMLYESKGDNRRALAASEKALLMVEANYRAQPQNKNARTERWNVLLRLTVQYPEAGEYDRAIEAGRQMVSLADESPNLGPFSRDMFRAQSLRDLGLAFLRCGRRSDALDTFHQALTLLDRYPIEEEKSPTFQRDLANNYLFIADHLVWARREEESAVLLRRLAPVFEETVRERPGNSMASDFQLRGWRGGAKVFLAIGDLAGALDAEQKVLKAEPAPVSARDAMERVLRLGRVGSLHSRLGSREIAQKNWREALELFRRTGRESSAGEMANWENWIRGELGEVPRAVSVHEVSLQTGSGEEAKALAELAVHWRSQADAMSRFGTQPAVRLEVAARAVEAGRQLRALKPAEYSNELGYDLLAEGDALRAAGRESRGPEAAAAYRASRARYAEAQGVLRHLDKSVRLAGAPFTALITLQNNIEEADEGLRELSDMRAVTRK